MCLRPISTSEGLGTYIQADLLKEQQQQQQKNMITVEIKLSE